MCFSYSLVVDFGSTLSWLNFFGCFLLSRRTPFYAYNPMHTGVRFAAFVFDLYSFLTYKNEIIFSASLGYFKQVLQDKNMALGEQ